MSLRVKDNGLLARPRVAKMLGVSEKRIRQFEAAGDLSRARKEGGIVYYYPRDITRLIASRIKTPSQREGELAAAVFDAFAGGTPLPDIVRRLKISPAAVRELWREYHVDLATGEKQRRETEAGQEAAQHYAELARDLDSRLNATPKGSTE